jgi:hypothetical protein
MKPCLCHHRWHMGGDVNVRGVGKYAAGAEGSGLFGIELLDHSEAAELALHAIEIAVVISITGDENDCG